ncbi:alpha-E domain-containing protein [Saccharolobus solfataricus]|uniref:Alpha-E domain-containing protein n=1 Tax=Saccharolobus solfataricus TaxID=2287 RepID=A0A7S9NQE6_SACSO|nr:alpha-E domain-containing protein [Saccharolobus solfataricus]QPG48984.1 alpha-E domain-containing protein [Saccharolobus solfataricus]
MLPKSIAYKIYWAGRYLERIENICRMSLLAINNGLNINTVAKQLGFDNEYELINYVKTSFQYLRENVRSFADEKVIIQVNTLEFLIDSDKSDLQSYITQLLNGVYNVGNSFEKFFVEVRSEMRIRPQQENQPE